MLERDYYENGQLKLEHNYEDGKLDGLSKEYFENGQLKYIHNYKNGEYHGLLKGYYIDGKLKYEFNYKNDKKDGLCKDYFENGQLKFEGNYKEGKLDGLCKDYFENGQLKFEGNYKEGKFHGLCKGYYETGQLKFEGNYKEGKRHGLCKDYYETGQLEIEENYKEDKRHGLRKEYYEDGQLKNEGNYKEEKLNGLCKDYYETGKLEYEKNYKEGKRHGLCKGYYETGQLKFECNYKEGKLHGLCKDYYETGQLKIEENYKEDKRNGLCKNYFENGKLKLEYNYKEDKKDGLCKEYYEDGQLELEYNYKEDKRNGLCKKYYEDGQLKFESNYKEDKRHGLCKGYYENGQLEFECNYKDGKLHGLCKDYYETGKLEHEKNYKEEKLDGLCKSYYETGQLDVEFIYKEGKLDGLCKKYYETGQLDLEYNYKEGKYHGLCKKYYEDGQLIYEVNYKEDKKDGLDKGFYKTGQLEYEHNYKNDKLDGLCKNYSEDGKLDFENYFENDIRYFGKDYKYFIENNEEVKEELYYLCDYKNNEIIYQEDLPNNSLNIITRKNYIVLNGERICISKKVISNMKEVQNINDNIKLYMNNNYTKLDKNHYKNICSYKDIIAEIEVFDKNIFFEREFIKDEMLNGLKVLYKKNNGIREYIKIELYENNVKIKDNIEDRRRLINQYFISNEEKEEWINIPFIEDPNYTSKNSNKNIENLEASNNKALYIILPIIGVLVLGVILYFAFFKENNDYQEVSTQSTTSYSQPQAQQEVVKSTVVENNNLNNYIPTVEDARYINYKTYYNDYYDYSIDYPDDEYFQISKTYEDGMRLQNDNGEVIISLTSNWNPNGESLQQAYDKAVREKPNAPYKFLGKTFFTITYEDNGLLVFRKTMYDKNTNKYVYLYVSFPPEYKDYMTPIVERMANSMKKSVSNVTSTANNSYSDSQLENKFGRVVKDKYVGGSFIEFLRNANENEYYYLRDQFWEILNTMYVTEDNKTYYYLNDIIDQLETKADWDNSSRVISLEVKGNKMYYTVGFPKGYNANTPSWVQFEIFERKFNDGIGLRTAHVSCAINGVEYKDWDAVYAIFR